MQFKKFIPSDKFATGLMLVAILCAANPAQALQSEKGFHIGTLLGAGFSLDDNDQNDSVMGGFGLEAGYDFNERFDGLLRVAFEASLGRSSTGPFQLGGFSMATYDLGLRYSPWLQRFSPYLIATLGLANITNGDAQFLKEGFDFHTAEGAGFLFSLSPKNAIGLEGLHHFFNNERSAIQFLVFNLLYRFTF